MPLPLLRLRALGGTQQRGGGVTRRLAPRMVQDGAGALYDPATGTFAPVIVIGGVLDATKTYQVVVTDNAGNFFGHANATFDGTTMTVKGLIISNLNAAAITLGAADSGGAGYRLLRVPN